MPSKKLKVLVVAQTPPPHHGQAVMTEYFLSGSYQHIELLHIRMAFSREIGEVGRAGLGKVLHLFMLIFQIIQARIRHKPDVLYYPPAGADMVPFLRDCALLTTTRWMFPRTVFHFHAAGLPKLYERLSAPLKFLFHRAYDSPDTTISISTMGLSDAKFLKAQNAIVVPNGIPNVQADEPTEKSHPIPTILFLSMVCKEKGVGVLIEACKILKDRGLDFQCLIAGSAASEGELQEFQAQAAALGECVQFVGPVTGKAKWELFENADVFCFPTFYPPESFGVVVVEAMMMGLPVVASDWRALPEIIPEGETGFLVPIKDPIVTADRLAQLLSEPELRQKMGRAGRKRFLEKYTVNIFRENMEKALTGDF